MDYHLLPVHWQFIFLERQYDYCQSFHLLELYRSPWYMHQRPDLLAIWAYPWWDSFEYNWDTHIVVLLGLIHRTCMLTVALTATSFSMASLEVLSLYVWCKACISYVGSMTSELVAWASNSGILHTLDYKLSARKRNYPGPRHRHQMRRL